MVTTTDTDALNRRIRDEVYGTWISSCCDGAVINIDEAAEIAADLAPIVAVEVRKAKAEALREAADAWHAEHGGTRPGPYNWMWDRAAEHETGDSYEHR